MAAGDTILFDGDCAFCNGWVRWIRRRDLSARFQFTALASQQGLALRQQHGVPAQIDSVVLVQGGRAYLKSEAAWRILAGLPGHAFTARVMRCIPRALRDLGYDLVARNRKRLGMRDRCEMPDTERKAP
jgi:predicted DCC family thiol-disulfide oxidoreductase YuxK